MRKRDRLRQAVATRYNFRCGYCGVRENDVGAELTVDHFLPKEQGGDDSPDNLVYGCPACNQFKNKYWQTDPALSLLHPLLDNAEEHLRLQEDGTLLGLTERGTNHIEVLHLNRPRLIAHRLEQEIAALSNQLNQVLRQTLQQSEQRTHDLAMEVRRLRGN